MNYLKIKVVISSTTHSFLLRGIISRCSLTKLILRDILVILTAIIKLGSFLFVTTCPRCMEAIEFSTRAMTGQSNLITALPWRIKLLSLAEMIILVPSGLHSPLQ